MEEIHPPSGTEKDVRGMVKLGKDLPPTYSHEIGPYEQETTSQITFLCAFQI